LRRLTFLAIQLVAHEPAPSLFGQDPFSNHPRRLVPHVTAVAAVQVRDPIVVFILVKTDDDSFHVQRHLVII
jgi:hypothetical protein